MASVAGGGHHVPVDLGVKALRPWVREMIEEAVLAERQRASAELQRAAEELQVCLRDLRPWVQALVRESAEEERRRASEDLKRTAEELRKLLGRSLQQTIEGFERALGEECDARRRELDEAAWRLQEEGQARRAALQAQSDLVCDEQRQRAASEKEIAEKAAEEGRAWRSELSGAEAKLAEARKELGAELSRRVKEERCEREAAVMEARKDARERAQELEGSAEERWKEAEARVNGLSKDVEARVSVLSKDIKTRAEGLSREVHAKVDGLSKEVSKAQGDAKALRREDRAAALEAAAEDRRDMEALVAAEASTRGAELGALEVRQEEDSRRLREEVAQALHNEARAREEAVARELEERRSEAAELGSAVGADVARLRASVAQQLDSERRSRDSEAQKVASGLSELSAGLSEVRGRLEEEAKLVRGHYGEFTSHRDAVSASLGSSGSDLIGVAEALKKHAKEAEERSQEMRKEVEGRCGALEERCGALDSQHREHVGKIEKALGSKGGAEALVAVQEALDRKADAASVEDELEKIAAKVLEAETDMRARGEATMEATLEAVQGRLDGKASAAEFEVLKKGVLGAVEELESNSAYVADTVAKKLVSVQRALDKKTDLKASAACVHIQAYMKNNGTKIAASGRKMAPLKEKDGASSRAATEDYDDLMPSSTPTSPRKSSPRGKGGALASAMRAISKAGAL